MPQKLLTLLGLALTATAFQNTTSPFNNITGGNSLWNGILRDCRSAPSMSCIQKNVFHYLDDTLNEPGDLKVGQFMSFKPNQVDYTKYTVDQQQSTPQDESEPRSTPLEEVTHALSDKGVKFLMTHDMEIQLPALMEGAKFKVSPRGFEGDGVLVRLDMIQPQKIEARSMETKPRFLFQQIFKQVFKKFFKNKLLTAFLSLLLVLKMLKVKLLFIAPILLGVGTAKKILLKVLLFLFPALAHLFKLCSYYHNDYHKTKYHHHHHQIAHVHHGLHPGVEPSWGPDVHGPSLHHAPEIHVAPHHEYFKHEMPGYEFSGPGLGPEYISNRNAYEPHTPSAGDDNEIKSWGLGQGHRDVKRGHQPKLPPAPLTRAQIEQLALQAEKDAFLQFRLQQEQMKLRQQNLRLQEQLKQELKLQEQLKVQAMMLQKNKGVNIVPNPGNQGNILNPGSPGNQGFNQAGNQGYSQPGNQGSLGFSQGVNPGVNQRASQTEGISQVPYSVKQSPISKTDPFYSPILQRIDAILNGLGFTDEPCRERLICSMYKNPVKFSPHSNLISAELSRDSKELVKPTSSNDAVVRFYKYVQAARDGQDQRECLRLYPSCKVNTE